MLNVETLQVFTLYVYLSNYNYTKDENESYCSVKILILQLIARQISKVIKILDFNRF
jgi:hypothetical protein